MHVTGKPCDHPLSSGDSEANSINVTIMGITDPITEGTTAIFSCPLGQILMGPNVSVCMENGEWVPDTEEVQCVKGKFKIKSSRLSLMEKVMTLCCYITTSLVASLYYGKGSLCM